MHHYVALIWNRMNPEAANEALRLSAIAERSLAGWTRLAAAPGMCVYSGPSIDAGTRTYVLPGGSGVIIGRLFEAAGKADPSRISLPSARQIVSTGGRHLLEHYWGQYVAIVVAEPSLTSYVIRDCSGHIPCYYTEQHGVLVFFSSLADIVCFGFRFTVNDRYLALMVLRHPLHLADTAINEVREALSGNCVVLSAAAVEQYSLWRPYDIAAEPALDDYRNALSALRAATETAIANWASVHGRILLYLSGGLDSAIVLGSLARLGLAGRVACVNHYTAGTTDDERDFARAAARIAGVSLTEVPRLADGEAFFARIQRLPCQPKPNISHLSQALAVDDTNCVAAAHECDVIWTGQGGDHIFLQRPHPYGAADYAIRHRISPKFLSTVYDSALLDRDSVWSVLVQAFRYWFPIASPSSEQGEERFNGAGLLNPISLPGALSSACAPWTRDLAGLPPGKRMQVRDFADLMNRHQPLSGVERIYQQHPLISQPLLETSLRIPTYHLQRGGRHRAMARDAFADRVPSCILEREGKGDILDNISSLLRGSAPLLRDFLLDGALVSRGILQRAALERVLLGDDTYRTTEIFPIWASIAAEIWVRNWEQTPFS